MVCGSSKTTGIEFSHCDRDLITCKTEILDNLTLYRESLLISVIGSHSPGAVFCGGGGQRDTKGFRRYMVPL